MIVQAQDIKNWIEQGLPNSVAEVEGDGHHFHARIISQVFAGKTLLQQQRMVYAVLGEKIGREIHALSMVTLTPEQAVVMRNQ